MSTEIPSFLLRRGDKNPDVGRQRPVPRRNIGRPPGRNPHGNSDGMVTLVKANGTTRPVSGIEGYVRLPDYLGNIDVGTVLVHRAVDPAIPPIERPWQAGRAHREGIRWEEKT